MEERWIAPGSKCDCCGRDRRPDETWTEEHVSSGFSGFTFDWCPECERDQQAKCNEAIADCLTSWRRRCEEHWLNNPPPQ